MTNPPAPCSVAGRFVAILDDLCRTVPVLIRRDRSAGPLIILIYTRLRRLTARLTAIAARFEAGTLRGRRGASTCRRDRSRPAPARASGWPRPLPGGFAWLVRLVPETAHVGTRLQHLLETDAEIAALLAAAPQAGRILRSLLWMAGIRPVPAILRRTPARPVPAPGSGSGPTPSRPAAPGRHAIPAVRAIPARSATASPGGSVGPDVADPRHAGEPGDRPPDAAPRSQHGASRRPREPGPDWLRSPKAAYAGMNRLLGIVDAPPFPA